MHGPINLQVGVPVVDQSHPTSHPQHNPTKIQSRMSEYVLYTTDTSANSVKDRPVLIPASDSSIDRAPDCGFKGPRLES